MIDLVDFLGRNGLITPSLLAVALAGVAYQLSRSIRDLQVELKAVSRQQADTAALLATTVAVLARIDESGTKSELRHRENSYGRWDGAVRGK